MVRHLPVCIWGRTLELVTERLVLRPFLGTDAGALQGVMNPGLHLGPFQDFAGIRPVGGR